MRLEADEEAFELGTYSVGRWEWILRQRQDLRKQRAEHRERIYFRQGHMERMVRLVRMHAKRMVQTSQSAERA
ncbi:hypothetical protein PHSY_000817 [Pseudozyma hubeiensis SY62]|uniref:Uncharacterized protein n=1 Tax=Pseudozyma hubeiensis (strain SY62) TaxID=1305764 RepID=R9NX75_PSEHS|nr:hypothetical protein PHSY_000817 [Pseudozyma hubeiensis SY62]GAC93253.1 hypothetical protein PHSY_000817 [Pseudozyma hubeiensis SY62]